MADIGIIVNHHELHALAEKATSDYADSVEIATSGDYAQSKAEAMRLIQNGALALVSRGGHRSAIEKAGLGVPVVSMPFTASNLNSQLIQAKKQFGKFAMIGNAILIDMTREVEEAMGLDVMYCLIDSWDSFETHVAAAKQAGIRAMVGGYDASSFGERAGLHTFVVHATEVEVAAALHEAKTIVDRIKREKHWDGLLRKMLDSIYEGVVLVDAEGKVTHVNQPAKQMLEKEGPVLFGHRLPEHLHKQTLSVLKTGAPIKDALQKSGMTRCSVSILPVGFDRDVSGAIALMQEVEHVQKMEHKIRHQLAERGLVARHTFHDILGDSEAMRAVIQTAKQYSLVDSTILINGESGTGKEFIAQSIHNHSLRRNEPFVAVNCATIPTDLLGSELFGYDDGAFTGAKKGGKIGLFELAHNGTIFLDEIGEISTDVQARLLRVLEERQIMRLGGDRVIPVNIRVIAATNKDLRLMVGNNTFRDDVFYRINVLALTMPPLRERAGDVALLLRYFVRYFCDQYNRNHIEVLDEAMRVFLAYDWPGNIRELKNVMERLVVTGTQPHVGGKEAMAALGQCIGGECFSHAVRSDHGQSLLQDNEDALVERVLRDTGGNKAEAARRLGISRPTLHKRLKRISKKY